MGSPRVSVFASTYRHSSAPSQQKIVNTTTPVTNVETRTFTPVTGAENLPAQTGSKEAGLPTPIRSDRLNKLLVGYPKAQLFKDGFEKGFLFDFRGNETPLNSTNSLSAMANAEEVTKKIEHELKMGRLAGPYDNVPCDNFKCFPLALREKFPTPPPHLPKKYRLLHNMSYPYNEDSVNFNIPKTSSTVQYANIQSAIWQIQKHSPKAFMAKADISDAFRLLPLHPSQYHLAGFSWNNKFYMG